MGAVEPSEVPGGTFHGGFVGCFIVEKGAGNSFRESARFTR